VNRRHLKIKDSLDTTLAAALLPGCAAGDQALDTATIGSRAALIGLARLLARCAARDVTARENELC
jgi:hypothetical protein